MPGENIQDWSTTALTNGSADSSINWAESMPRASVNNSARSMMAAHAKQRNLTNGSIVTTGSANVHAFLSGMNYTAPIPSGLRVLLRIGAGLTNTGSPVTLNMDSIGAVAIKDQFANDILIGALTAGSYAEFCYNGTNWILLGLPGRTLIPGGSGLVSLPSGYVGEYYESSNLTVTLLAVDTYTTLHTVTLNPGDWDVRGKVRLIGTPGQCAYISLSPTTNAGSGTPDSICSNVFTSLADLWFSVGPSRFLLSASANVYLTCYPIATGLTLHTAIIQARRVQ